MSNLTEIDFTDRNSWGFKDLNINDAIEVDCDDIKLAQRYAHAYGNITGKKFATRTIDGKLYVKRLA